jgi:hypothetical protein
MRKKNYLEAPPARSIRLDLFGGDPGEEGRRPGDRCRAWRWGGAQRGRRPVQRRPAPGRGAGGAKGGRRERGVGRTKGQAHGRTGWGAEGGVCGGKCVHFSTNRGKGCRPEKALASCILDSQRSDGGKNQAYNRSVWRDSRFYPPRIRF